MINIGTIFLTKIHAYFLYKGSGITYSKLERFCLKSTTRMGFEPTRTESIGLAVQRLNHSATSSTAPKIYYTSSPTIHFNIYQFSAVLYLANKVISSRPFKPFSHGCLGMDFLQIPQTIQRISTFYFANIVISNHR